MPTTIGVANGLPFVATSDTIRIPDYQRGLELYRAGKYSEVVALAAVAELDAFMFDEGWAVLKANAQMSSGKYADALKTLDESLKRFPNSIRVRWIGIEICNYNNLTKRARDLSAEIERFWLESSWRYRDIENMIVLGRYFQTQRMDAKKILKDFYGKAKIRNPEFADVYVAIGDLALGKHDYKLAAENYSKAIQFDSTLPGAHFGLAKAFRESDSEKSQAALKQTLAINAKHVPSLLMQVDQLINAEQYTEAETTIQKILDVNPEQTEAWAYRAAIAHLENDHKAEGEYRGRALKHWQANPMVDHLIGTKLSQKYRFKEGETYQRRALTYDPFLTKAKIQLAHDLLRLGQELEGWKLADEVFDEDQYSVVAHNLVNLRNHIAKFATLEDNGFIVRMDSAESEIYGDHVLQLLRDAKKQLCDKYDVELETPIFIEIFPEQQDFAIRTFGLPGGQGFLGVCFGRVVTMNSPAGQGTSLTNWKSVLWHEFCHVVTLQKTKNRMPRWLSEGISVYEERLANPAWGQSMNPRYREMILSDDFTPVSKLSSAFLQAKSAKHLDFAYFESSLVVEYLIDKYGLDALKLVLRDLGIGVPVNDALRRHTAPTHVLDAQFEAHAIQLADKLAPDADWTKPDLPPEADSSTWAAWNREHENNVVGLMAQAKSLIGEKKTDEAIQVLQQMLQVYSDQDGAQDAYAMLASIYRDNNDTSNEIKSLKKIAQLDASSVEANSRLMELSVAANNWDDVEKYATQMLGINPLIKSPHRYLAAAAEKKKDDQVLIPALSALAKMDPIDPADVNYRLASALFRKQQYRRARRHVLLALDQAPRYRDAHQLLLKIAAALKAGEDDESRQDVKK